MAWQFDKPGGSYSGRLLIDGEIYTTSEATKKFLTPKRTAGSWHRQPGGFTDSKFARSRSASVARSSGLRNQYQIPPMSPRSSSCTILNSGTNPYSGCASQPFSLSVKTGRHFQRVWNAGFDRSLQGGPDLLLCASGTSSTPGRRCVTGSRSRRAGGGLRRRVPAATLRVSCRCPQDCGRCPAVAC